MNVPAYLARIGVAEPVTVDRDGLEMLQRAHLTAVPFENLDVFYGRGVRTGTDWSVPKVVDRARGGWCYELNGAFGSLLESLGFSVTLLAAIVLLDDTPADEPDHLTLRVDLDRPYLVDVGFGDSFIRPLPLDSPGPHDGGSANFGFGFETDATTLVDLSGDPPQPQYRFNSSATRLSDFDGASQRLQTQPGTGWTARPFATRLLDGGPDRVTLVGDRIKFRRNGKWSEQPVADDVWEETLDEWFGMSP